LQVDREGCPICGSTWGDHVEEVGGDRWTFCCAICARQFRHLLERVRGATGWPGIDRLEVRGDRRGRRCVATRGRERVEVEIAFDPLGEVRRFSVLPAPAGAG
jgi:hypothetical protein